MILVELSDILYGPPEGGDITLSVKVPHMGRVLYTLRIRADHLKGWLKEVTRENYP